MFNEWHRFRFPLPPPLYKLIAKICDLLQNAYNWKYGMLTDPIQKLITICSTCRLKGKTFRSCKDEGKKTRKDGKRTRVGRQRPDKEDEREVSSPRILENA